MPDGWKSEVSPLFTYLLLCIGTLVALNLAVTYRRKRRLKALPGPWLPTYPKTSDVNVQDMQRLVHKYGPMIGFRFVTINILYLCDVDSIKDALLAKADAFSGRVQVPVFRSITKDCGVAFTDGPKWHEQRRFALGVLRSFGFGRNITERIIQDELVAAVQQLSDASHSALSPAEQVSKAVANVLSLLIFNERVSADGEFALLSRVAVETVETPAFSNVFFMLIYRPLLLLPGDYIGLKKYLRNMERLHLFLKKKIAVHLETINYDFKRDLLDAYLIEQRKQETLNPGKHNFTDFMIFRVAVEIFIAGTETTSTMLNWALLLMAKHPHVQARVQAEIDSVIGDKLPQIADRAKLVYTTAVLHEVERYATVTPFSLPHRVTEDTEVRGYYIPKNTIVTPYLFGAHRDERIWKNPKQFDPSHFYDESSNSLVNVHNLLTFSVGKRACLGQSLAIQEVFVFFTGLLQRFRFESDCKYPLPEIAENKLNLNMRLPPKYFVVVSDRLKSAK